MLKWLLTLLIVVVILAVATPALSRRFGRMPGDLRVPVRGRLYWLPFGSALAASLLAWAVGRFL